MLVKRTITEVKEEVVLEGEEKELLHDLYQEIWCQACYDPDTTEISEYCEKKLLPKIKRLNEILKFKE